MSPTRRRPRREYEEESLPYEGAKPRGHRALGCFVIIVGIGLLWFVLQAANTLSRQPESSGTQGATEASDSTVTGQELDTSVLDPLPPLKRIEVVLKASLDYVREIVVTIFGAISSLLLLLISLIQQLVSFIASLNTLLKGGT